MAVSRSTVITLVFLVVCVAVLTAVVYVVKERAAERDREASPAGVALAGDTEIFTSLSGETVDLFSEAATPIVVYTWASWCPQCAGDLEALAKLAAESRDSNQPVKFVAINRNEPTATAERFLASLDVNDALDIVIDTEDSYYTAIEGYAMPELVVFSAAGDELLRQRGAIDLSAVANLLEAEYSANE